MARLGGQSRTPAPGYSSDAEAAGPYRGSPPTHLGSVGVSCCTRLHAAARHHVGSRGRHAHHPPDDGMPNRCTRGKRQKCDLAFSVCLRARAPPAPGGSFSTLSGAGVAWKRTLVAWLRAIIRVASDSSEVVPARQKRVPRAPKCGRVSVQSLLRASTPVFQAPRLSGAFSEQPPRGAKVPPRSQEDRWGQTHDTKLISIQAATARQRRASKPREHRQQQQSGRRDLHSTFASSSSWQRMPASPRPAQRTRSGF